MSDTCFTSEVYALYAIGSLDGEELTELESHRRRGCELCRVELDQARELWYAYAAATPPATPHPDVKRRLMAAIAPPRLHVMPPRRSFRWIEAIAAILILAAGIGVGWQLHHPVAAIQAPQAALSTPPAATAQIERENQDLKARIAALDARLAEQGRQAPPAAVQGNTAAGLEQTVARLQAEVASRAQIVQEAQSHAAQLQTEVDRLRDQAAAADQRAKQFEQQYQTAATDRKQAVDRESRLRTEFTARIRQLEGENEKFQRVIDEQQRKIQQNLQMVSFFSSPNLRFYQYKGTRSGPAATAHVVAQEGSRVLFYAFHLPQLPAGRTYQLWLIRGQSPAVVSGGIFHVDRDGNAVVEFNNPALTRDVRQFAVTDEPASGSPGPTGSQFFRAS